MNLYAALFLERQSVQHYQDQIAENFSGFELIPDVHLSLCHMQIEDKMPDLYECFVDVPDFQGVRWDLFEGRFSPYVYLVLVIKPNNWLKNLWNDIDKKFKIEVINGDYHISLAKIKKEEYSQKSIKKLLKKLPKADKCSLSVKTLEIRERFSTEKVFEINLVR